MSEQSTSYQGWPNYETWNAALWLGNDERAYNLLMNQLVFNVTNQQKKNGLGYDRAVESAAHKAYGDKTPDGVVLTPAKTKVDWASIADSYRAEIDELETAWLDILEALPRNPQGGFSGLVEATDKFRAEHRYGR